MMERVWENSWQLKIVNYFRKKAPSKMAEKVLNTPLPFFCAVCTPQKIKFSRKHFFSKCIVNIKLHETTEILNIIHDASLLLHPLKSYLSDVLISFCLRACLSRTDSITSPNSVQFGKVSLRKHLQFLNWTIFGLYFL